MATRKTKPAPNASKAKAKPLIEQPVVREVSVVATAGRDSGRLLREAAWSAMFGRVESKNPFTR
jgi:hypothetical protein